MMTSMWFDGGGWAGDDDVGSEVSWEEGLISVLFLDEGDSEAVTTACWFKF